LLLVVFVNLIRQNWWLLQSLQFSKGKLSTWEIGVWAGKQRLCGITTICQARIL